jgi:hypothetical protein
VSYGTITKTQKLSHCAADEHSSLLYQTPVGSIRHYPEDGGRKNGRNGVAYTSFPLCHTPEYSNLYVNEAFSSVKGGEFIRSLIAS